MDARYEKVRVDGRVVSQEVLIISAVRDGGQGATYQRCQVYYVRNLLEMVSYATRKDLGVDLYAGSSLRLTDAPLSSSPPS